MRDSKIGALYVLNGTVLYAREAQSGIRWIRIVHGVRTRARHVPTGGGVGTIGIDRAGHVIATFETFRGGHRRWWVYDAFRDRRRPLAQGSRCEIGDVAIWRRQTVMIGAGRCGQTSPGQSGILALRGASASVARLEW